MIYFIRNTNCVQNIKSKGDYKMKKLMQEYKHTAENLYISLKKFKNNTKKYKLILSEYQHTCSIHNQLLKYCKARGII